MIQNTIELTKKEPFKYFSSWILDDEHLIRDTKITFFMEWIEDPVRTNMPLHGNLHDRVIIDSIRIHCDTPNNKTHRSLCDESYFELVVGDKPYKMIPSTVLANPYYLERSPDGLTTINANITLDRKIMIQERQLFYITMHMTSALQDLLNAVNPNHHMNLTVTLNTYKSVNLPPEEAAAILSEWRLKRDENSSKTPNLMDYCQSLGMNLKNWSDDLIDGIF
jgi:hypothetical protein